MCEVNRHYPTVLAIAGSDSIGGAGIQADIKTCMALRVYAMTAVTAVTAQNTEGVVGSLPIPPQMLIDQIEAVLKDVRPDAVKIGMLPTAGAVRIVSEFIKKYDLTNIVIDPVWVATSGFNLVEPDVPQAMLEYLLPLANVVTPNIPEANKLLRSSISKENAPEAAASLRQAICCEGLLLKGGHLNSGYSIDFFSVDGDVYTFGGERIDTCNTHGTGCTLSSAIAAFLAIGEDMVTAVGKAVRYVHEAIASGVPYKFGHGSGPLNHGYKIIR